ncbi:MAG: hypothetical protein MUE40_12500 [Anaerolineae bacterium]|jgi:hypothetical protein|nr:hypothetical protein [Anaerolineae bacterium]
MAAKKAGDEFFPVMQSFGFDATDLAHNADQQLSPRQRRALNRQRYGRMLSVVVIGGVLLLMLFSTWGTSGVWVTLLFALLALFTSPPAFTHLRRLQRDCQTGQAARVDGLLWKGARLVLRGGKAQQSYYLRVGRYETDISSQQYNALIENRPYRLYYAPATRRLLSLEFEPIETPDDASDREQVQRRSHAALRMLLDFDDDDLAANRDGRLTAAQAQALARREERLFQRWLGLIGGVLLLLALSAYATFIGELLPGALWAMIGCAVVLALLLAALLLDVGRVQRDRHQGRVLCVQGRLRKSQALRRFTLSPEPVVYLVQVGAIVLEVEQALLSLLLELETYTLYYTPHSHILLAVEPPELL